MNHIFQFVLFAIMNRGRGSGLSINSFPTTYGRLISLGCIAVVLAHSITQLIVYWLCLELWAVFAWDVYWGAAAQSAGTVVSPAFVPSDWILAKLKITPGSRLWGVVGMGTRQGICMFPLFCALSYFNSDSSYFYFSLVPFLFGIPYWLWSLIPSVKSTGNFVMYSELTVGALMGLIL